MNFGMLVARSPLPTTRPESPTRTDQARPALRPATAATLAHRWNEIVAMRVNASRELRLTFQVG